MRTAFINQLIQEADTNKNIFLLVGDLGYSVVEPFAEKFPDRFLNVGIAEQNMTGIACGLAKEGYCVFTYSIGNFPTLRCMEQIRYDVCYHNLNVNVVAVGGGYAYGALGVSHHTTEELGMLRTIPNLIVAAPGDPIETQKIVTEFCSNNSPTYLRLGKAGEPIIHTTPINLQIGKPLQILAGNTTAVFSTGAMLAYARQYIQQNKLNHSLYSFPIIKPLNIQAVAALANKYQNIITIEEHQMSCGFGSAILEALNDASNAIQQMPKVKRIAIPDAFIGYAGSQKYLQEQAGLVL